MRELANAMAHVRLLSQTDVILPEHLPPAVRKAVGSDFQAPFEAALNWPAMAAGRHVLTVSALDPEIEEPLG